EACCAGVDERNVRPARSVPPRSSSPSGAELERRRLSIVAAQRKREGYGAIFLGELHHHPVLAADELHRRSAYHGLEALERAALVEQLSVEVELVRHRGDGAHHVDRTRGCLDVHREHVHIPQRSLCREAHPSLGELKNSRLQLSERTAETRGDLPRLLGRGGL